MGQFDDDTSHPKVVISGIAGRFPKSDNVSVLQENLLNKVDCTTSDHGRWNIDNPNVPQRIGKCNDIQKFDRVFFGLHVKLTNRTDPMSRLLLEHSYEAILDAGINPRSLRGSKIAVIVATSLSETLKDFFFPCKRIDGFGIVGTSKSMIANRISYFLGLTGPSFNIDGGCAGAGTALERAYYEIKEGRCDAAIVGGCMLNLYPHLSHQLKIMGILSADGKTRSFDDAADGHSRSDGMGVLFLQRSTDAKRIYMEVLNVRTTNSECLEVNNSMIYPTVTTQINLMKQLLNESGLSPDDIDFLEASGVGIRDADADELEAINAVYGKRRNPMPIGSVKSNLGNAFAVNTINSIIKVIIASETGKVPPTINYEKLNSKAVGIKEGKIYIPSEIISWTGRFSSINTTSSCGLFSNVLLKRPDTEQKNQAVVRDDLPRLIVASGRTEESVSTILDHVQSIPFNAELTQLLYDIFESDIDGHLYRGHTIISSKHLPCMKEHDILFNAGEKREIWWVFAGMGSQWVGMGEALLKIPVFEAAIKRCDSVLKSRGFDIYKIIVEKDPKTFDNIIHSFIGIAAIQVGLVDVLRSVGLEPDYFIGHSVGELACGYADGCFTAEEMVLAALSRGLASVETELIHGSMAAVGLGYDDIKTICPPDIEIACHNSPTSSTISGPAESMKEFVTKLKAKGIFAKEVPSGNIAFHSRYIAEAAPKLIEYLQRIITLPKTRSSKWLSTSVPSEKWHILNARLCSAEYHTNNFLYPVLFEEITRRIPPNAICVEIAPHGLLQAILKKSLPDTCINIALAQRNHPNNLELLLRGLGKLYNTGNQPKISNLYPRIKYPVSRGTPSISSLIRWDHSGDWYIHNYKPIKKNTEFRRTFEIDINKMENKYLQGNIINGKMVIPLSLGLIKAWEILKSCTTNLIPGVIFEDIKIHKRLMPIPDNRIINLTVTVLNGAGEFEIVESETILASGVIKRTITPHQESLNIQQSNSCGQHYEFSKDDFYTEMQMRGYQYSGDFKTIFKSLNDGTRGSITWVSNWVTLIDGALQLYAFGNDTRQVEMPLSIRKIIIDNRKHKIAVINSEVLKVFVDKQIRYLSVGGLEIQGIQLALLPKEVDQNRFSTDILNVVPNIDKSNLSLVSSLRSILQVVLENTFSQGPKQINLVINHESDRTRTLKNIVMYDLPEVSLFKVEIVLDKDATFNTSLTILTEDFNNYNCEEIMKKLHNRRFLLMFIRSDEENSCIKSAESVGLKIILIKKSSNGTFILLRKKQSLEPFQFINVTKNIIETFNKIKRLRFSSVNERLFIIIKSKDNINFTEFLDLLEKTVKIDNIRIYYIQDPNISGDIFENRFYQEQSELDLFINILTPEKEWATLRHTVARQNPKLVKSWIANQIYAHDPMSITWTEGPILHSYDNIIKVECSSLNPQDILIANGSFYGDPADMISKNRLKQPRLGIEFSGTDSKGNRLMGITRGNSMSNLVVADSVFTWTIPKSWSFEDAATVPLSYVIAYSTLRFKADIKEGDRIIITNPCNVFGLAILHLVLQMNCEVFLIYETQSEKDLIRLMYPKMLDNHMFKSHINDLRDNIVTETQGLGMDVIICNSHSVNMLRTLLTIAKLDSRVVMISDLCDDEIHKNIGLNIFLSSVSFYTVVPKRIITSDASTKKTLATMLREGINAGFVKPLNKNVYNRTELSEAFYHCCTRKNLGKIVVKVRSEGLDQNLALAIPRLYCPKSKSYLIIEGLTTFGLELIDWLITRNARRVVIASTFKCETGYQHLRLNLWRSYGVKIILKEEFDLSRRSNVRTLIKEASSLGPIDAIFDLNRIELTRETDIMNSITKIADEESRISCPELRLFVVCSTNTNSENFIGIKKLKYLDFTRKSQEQLVEEILERRRTINLHGLLIRLGLSNSTREYNDMIKKDTILPTVTKYLQKFDEILGGNDNVVEINYTVSPVNKVESNIMSIKSTVLDQNEKEMEDFIAHLNQEVGTSFDGISLL